MKPLSTSVRKLQILQTERRYDMKKFCEIMVVVYIILFIPAGIIASTFDLYGQIGAEYVSKFIVSSVSFLVKSMPLVVFAAAGFGYAMNKTDKYNISFYILLVPIVIFIYIWLAVMCA